MKAKDTSEGGAIGGGSKGVELRLPTFVRVAFCLALVALCVCWINNPYRLFAKKQVIASQQWDKVAIQLSSSTTIYVTDTKKINELSAFFQENNSGWIRETYVGKYRVSCYLKGVETCWLTLPGRGGHCIGWQTGRSENHTEMLTLEVSSAESARLLRILDLQ